MIRPLKSSDLPQIKKIYIKSNNAVNLALSEDHFSKDSLKYINETLHICQSSVFEENGQVLGIISISNDYIEGLFVHPKHWKKGIGSALIDHVLKNRDGLKLQVYEKNTTALEFYRKHGFKIIGSGICQITGLKYFEMEI